MRLVVDTSPCAVCARSLRVSQPASHNNNKGFPESAIQCGNIPIGIDHFVGENQMLPGCDHWSATDTDWLIDSFATVTQFNITRRVLLCSWFLVFSLDRRRERSTEQLLLLGLLPVMNNYNQLHKPSLPFPVLNLITLPYLLLSFCSIKIKLPAIDNDVRVSKVTRVEEVGDEEGNGVWSWSYTLGLLFDAVVVYKKWLLLLLLVDCNTERSYNRKKTLARLLCAFVERGNVNFDFIARAFENHPAASQQPRPGKGNITNDRQQQQQQ